MTAPTAAPERYTQKFEAQVLHELGHIRELVENPPVGRWAKGAQLWRGRFASYTAFRHWLRTTKSGKSIQRRKGGYYHLGDIDAALAGEAWRGDGQPCEHPGPRNLGLKKGNGASLATRARRSPAADPMLGGSSR